MEELIEQLKLDLGRELAVIDIYQKYAKQIRDPVARQLFMTLISQSMGHADAFRSLLYKKTFGAPHDSGLSEVALGNLLFFGMKEEREIRLLYEAQLPTIADADYASTLRKIIEDERRHEAMLKEAYDRLKQESL